MAEHINKIAADLGANIMGKVPETSGGAFGAARLAHATGALSQADEANDELIGSMRDYADEMDEIVEDAMRQRQVQSWRPNKEDFAALEAMSEATGQPLSDLLNEALRLFLRQTSIRPPTGA